MPRVPLEVCADRSGRSCRVAIVDSGVRFRHPLVGGPPTGVDVDWVDGEIVVQRTPAPDRTGHGTACAAIVRSLARDAALVSVRVTGDGPSTDALRLARGVEIASELAEIVCVPLGTRTDREELRAAVVAASARAVIVAADPGDADIYPACTPGVLGVRVFDGVDVGRAAGQIVADGSAIELSAPMRRKDMTGARGPSFSAARAAAAAARVFEETGLVGPELAQEFYKRLPVVYI